jgi:hypothetical protein
MTTAARSYRCRIHDGITALATFTSPATAGGNALVVTSVRGGVNPYIGAPPSGDGQSIDLVTGASELGAYRVQVIDESLGGTTRVVTSVLADANARWQLLSRRAVVEWSADGVTWATLVLGYLNGLRLAGALVWDLSIGETRRTEMRAVLFRDVAPVTAGGAGPVLSPTCLLGGPIRVGAGYNQRATAFGEVEDFGPARMRVKSEAGQNAKELSLELVGAWLPPRYAALKPHFDDLEFVALNVYARRFFVADDATWAWAPASDSNCYGSFPGLAAQLQRVGSGQLVTCRPLARPARKLSSVEAAGIPIGLPGDNRPAGTYDDLLSIRGPLRVEWDTTTMGAKPADGTLFDVVVYVREPSAEYPVHERGHPVDLVTAKFAAAGVAYDVAAAAAARAAINAAYGGTVTCELTWDTTQKLGEYARQLLAFFGVGLRVSGAGQLQMFGLRHAVPVSGVTITLASLRDAETDTFDLDEGSVVTTTEQETRDYLFTRSSEKLTEGTTVPLNNLRPATRTIRGATDDTVAAAEQRTHRWELPGRVLVNGRPQSLEGMARAAGDWLVNWRRRGAAEFDLHCSPAVTAQVGDAVTVSLPHLPVAVLGAVPRTQRGQASIQARVLRRTETPAGPNLRLVYAPALAQAPLPAPGTGVTGPVTSVLPEIVLEPSTSESARVAMVRVVNALELLAVRMLIAFEYAFVAEGGDPPAGSGTAVGPYDPADAPASPVRYAMPLAPAGSVVWVRARSIFSGTGGGSDWTPWTSLALSTLPEGVRVSWTLEPAPDALEDGVRCALAISDPTGTIDRVELRFKARLGDAWPAYTVVEPAVLGVDPLVYLHDGTMVDGYGAYFAYRLSEFVPPADPEDPEDEGTYRVLEERTIPVGGGANAPTISSITAGRYGQFLAGQPYVKAGATLIVDARTRSIRIHSSTTGEPTAAEVIADGQVVNVPADTRSLTVRDLGVLDVGVVAYIAAIPYAGADGSGMAGVIVHASVSRSGAEPGEALPADVARTSVAANFTAGLQVNGTPVVPGTGLQGRIPIWGAGNVLGNSSIAESTTQLSFLKPLALNNSVLYGHSLPSMRVARNVTAYSSTAISHPGAIVIKTSIPSTADRMVWLRLQGYEYAASSATFSLEIGFYSYAAFAQYGKKTDGRRWRVRLAYSPDNFVCVVLDDVSSLHHHLKLWVSEAMVGHSAPVDAHLVGWATENVGSLSGYTQLTDVPEVPQVIDTSLAVSSLSVGASAGGSTGIELGNSMAVGSTPFLDFHYGAGYNQDFSGRLISRGPQHLGAEFLDPSTASFTIAGAALQAPLAYGGLRLPSASNAWSGIEFSTHGTNLLLNGSNIGFWKPSGWVWRFDDGVLVDGAVPPARVPAGTFPGYLYTFQGALSVDGALMSQGRDVPNVMWSTEPPVGVPPADNILYLQVSA